MVSIRSQVKEYFTVWAQEDRYLFKEYGESQNKKRIERYAADRCRLFTSIACGVGVISFVAYRLSLRVPIFSPAFGMVARVGIVCAHDIYIIALVADKIREWSFNCTEDLVIKKNFNAAKECTLFKMKNQMLCSSLYMYVINKLSTHLSQKKDETNVMSYFKENKPVSSLDIAASLEDPLSKVRFVQTALLVCCLATDFMYYYTPLFSSLVSLVFYVSLSAFVLLRQIHMSYQPLWDLPIQKWDKKEVPWKEYKTRCLACFSRLAAQPCLFWMAQDNKAIGSHLETLKTEGKNATLIDWLPACRLKEYCVNARLYFERYGNLAKTHLTILLQPEEGVR